MNLRENTQLFVTGLADEITYVAKNDKDPPAQCFLRFPCKTKF